LKPPARSERRFGRFVELTHGFEGRGKPRAALGDGVVTASTQEDHIGCVQLALGGHAAQEVEDTNPIGITPKGTRKALNFVLPHRIVGIADLEEQEVGRGAILL
jgi:hypothetical protein